MEDREDLLRFMQSKNPNVLYINDVKKTYAHKGEYYEVKYERAYMEPRILGPSTKEDKCLVNIEAFNMFQLNDKAIIWNL